MTIRRNIDLWDLSEDERNEIAEVYGSTPPSYIDMEIDNFGKIIKVTREGRI